MAGESDQFEAEVEFFDKTATGFPLPGSIIDALGAGKRPPVTVEVAGHTYRSTIDPYADWFFLPLNRANRAASGVAAGDIVTVAVRHDTEPRVVEVPGSSR